MTMIKVFFGDLSIDIPVHLTRTTPNYTVAWLMNASLNILKATNKNLCSNMTVIGIKTKCCKLWLMPHTNIVDLHSNGSLPDIEMFVSIDTLIPLTAWQKKCNLIFPVINAKNKQSENDKALTTKQCDFCNKFDRNLCLIKLRLSQTDIIDRFGSNENIENMKLSQVKVSGNFCGWANWIKLEQKRSKHNEYWLKTITARIEDEFEWDLSFETDKESLSKRSQIGMIKAESNLNAEKWKSVHQRDEMIAFAEEHNVDLLTAHKQRPKSLSSEYNEIVNDEKFEILLNEMIKNDNKEMIKKCVLTHFRTLKQIWICIKAMHQIKEDAISTSEYHMTLSNAFADDQRRIIDAFNCMKRAIGDLTKIQIAFFEWIVMIGYLAESKTKKFDEIMEKLSNEYLIYSDSPISVKSELIYCEEYKVYIQIEQLFKAKIVSLISRRCLKGRLAVINVSEWIRFAQSLKLELSEQMNELSKADLFAIFFESQNLNNRIDVELDELNGAEFLDLICRFVVCKMKMEKYTFKKKKIDIIIHIVKQIFNQLDASSFAC